MFQFSTIVRNESESESPDKNKMSDIEELQELDHEEHTFAILIFQNYNVQNEKSWLVIEPTNPIYLVWALFILGIILGLMI